MLCSVRSRTYYTYSAYLRAYLAAGGEAQQVLGHSRALDGVAVLHLVRGRIRGRVRGRIRGRVGNWVRGRGRVMLRVRGRVRRRVLGCSG